MDGNGQSRARARLLRTRDSEKKCLFHHVNLYIRPLHSWQKHVYDEHTMGMPSLLRWEKGRAVFGESLFLRLNIT
jgi:hypothetical protein